MKITPRGWLVHLIYAMARNEDLHQVRMGGRVNVTSGDSPPKQDWAPAVTLTRIWLLPAAVGQEWLAQQFPREYAAAILTDGIMEISKAKAFAVYNGWEKERSPKLDWHATGRQKDLKL